MSVVVASKDVGPWRRELTIEVPAPAVEAETERVVSQYARSARIPGFRKGKVPARIVRQRFRAEIDQDVLEVLVPRYWKQAEAEAFLEPLIAPRIGEVELEEGKDLTFVATVEVRPEIELSEDRSFDLPDPPTEVSDHEVDDAIENLRREVAPWVAVSRAGSRGDRAQIRLWQADGEPRAADQVGDSGTEEDEPETESAGEHSGKDEGHQDEPDSQEAPDEEKARPVQEVAVEIGDQQVWEELSLALVGLEAGQHGKFQRQSQPPPAGPDDPPPEPEVQSFELEVIEVQEKELAAVDDEFAQGLGEFEDLAALRAAVEKRIHAEKESSRSEQRRTSLVDQLIERHPLELPQGVVEQEVRSQLEDYAGGLSARGVEVDKAPVDWAALAEQVKPAASQRVHARLLLDAIADDEGITVSAEELESTVAALARSQGESPVAMRQALDRDGRLEALRQQLRRERTVKHLLGEDDPAIEATAAEESSEDVTEDDASEATDDQKTPTESPEEGAVD